MFSFWTLRLSAYSGKCLFEAGRLLNCRLFQPHILYQQNKEERTLLYLHTGYLREEGGGGVGMEGGRVIEAWCLLTFLPIRVGATRGKALIEINTVFVK